MASDKDHQKRLITTANIWWWLVCMLVFTLIASEVTGRIYLHYFLEKSPKQKFQFDSYRIYAHRPNFREGDGKKDWIVINGQGFRRTEDVSKNKRQGAFRVFLLGGSTAHGISSAAPYPRRHIFPDQTIDAHLETMLTAKYPGYHIEIINAAVTGYYVYQHTLYLLSELIDYEPDLIIFFDGANDHYATNPDYDSYRDNMFQFWKSRLQSPHVGALIDYAFLLLAKYSGFAKGYFAWRLQRNAEQNAGIIHLDSAPAELDDNERIERHRKAAERQFLRSIDINLLLLERFGIKAIVSLQPMLALRKEHLLSQEETNFFRSSKSVNVLYPVIKKELKEVTESYGVPFVDMVPVFNEHSLKGIQLFIDVVHLSPEGSEVAAGALFPLVEKMFLATIPKE